MRAVGRTLDRYVGGRFLATYGLVLLSFLMLFLVIDFVSGVEKLRTAAALRHVTLLAVAGEYYLTKLPGIISVVGPYLTMFAGIATVISLARHNELGPMVGAGRSMHRVLLPIYVASVCLVGLLVVVEERLVPAAQARHRALARAMSRKAGRPVDVPHLRDGVLTFATEGWVPAEQALLDVRCQKYTDPRGNLPEGRLTAERLVWRRHPATGLVDWYPVEGELQPSGLDPEGRPQMPIPLPPDTALGFRLTPNEIAVLAEKGEPKLPREQVRLLIQRYPLQRQLPMELLTRTTRPLSSLILLLLGIPLVTSAAQRSITTGLGVALITSMGYFAVDIFFQELGVRGSLDPTVAAWFAPAFFGSIALARIDTVPT